MAQQVTPGFVCYECRRRDNVSVCTHKRTEPKEIQFCHPGITKHAKRLILRTIRTRDAFKPDILSDVRLCSACAEHQKNLPAIYVACSMNAWFALEVSRIISRLALWITVDTKLIEKVFKKCGQFEVALENFFKECSDTPGLSLFELFTRFAKVSAESPMEISLLPQPNRVDVAITIKLSEERVFLRATAMRVACACIHLTKRPSIDSSIEPSSVLERGFIDVNSRIFNNKIVKPSNFMTIIRVTARDFATTHGIKKIEQWCEKTRQMSPSDAFELLAKSGGFTAYVIYGRGDVGVFISELKTAGSSSSVRTSCQFFLNSK